MVSREDHCLSDLLWRWRSGELGARPRRGHLQPPRPRRQVEAVGLPFHHVPVEPGDREEAERRSAGAAARALDLLVLARYMQILSADFLTELRRPGDQHPPLLPARLRRRRPLPRAHERGVKLIGATAHYVTEELDAGPIIDQDVVRIDHRASVADIERLGSDLERAVLLRAVRWHLADRVLRHGPKTVVFHGH